MARVMVVDDEPIVGSRLRPTLERVGLDVEVFQDATAAHARLGECHFDVVVTDLRMPGVDGLQLLDRALQRNARVQVLLITAFATPELKREVLARGAFDCIAKPFRIGELRDAVLRAVEAAATNGE